MQFLTHHMKWIVPTLLVSQCWNRFQSGSIVLEYLIQDTKVTIPMVKRMPAEDRTVSHWQLLVDWDLQRQRPFVIVDPVDPQGLLYLTSREYIAQQKVCMSNDYTLVVVARPGSKAPVPLQVTPQPKPSSQNSPYNIYIEDRFTRASRLNWRAFSNLKLQVLRCLPVRGGNRMISESTETVARTVLLWARYLAHYTEVKNPGTMVSHLQPFIQQLQKLLKYNGKMAAVLYLKVSLFCLYSYLAGNPVKNTWALGWPVRLSNGLPKSWSTQMRSSIRRGQLPVVRLMASLLNIYRAMEAPNKGPKVDTITSGHPAFDECEFAEFKKFCKFIFPRMLAAETGSLPKFKYESGFGNLHFKAGPNGRNAMAGIARDASAWSLVPSEKQYARQWFELHDDKRMMNLLSTCASDPHWEHPIRCDATPRLTPALVFMATRDAFSKGAEKALEAFTKGEAGVPLTHESEVFESPDILGRLHAIDEPAGKVRVVAIVDYFTQAALAPVHDWLFSILRNIRTDATFDQTGRVEEYYQQGLSPHWSYDLKSATDRIPMELYIEVLSNLMIQEGETLDAARARTVLWGRLLTDRYFLDPRKEGFVKYMTGQPMGALSSWASMALVHHALVQFSSWRATASENWFMTYRVLGDDLDIAQSRAVSERYVRTCDAFHIPIGMFKLIESERNFFEFANQRYSPDGNISPLSLKEELASITLNNRLEYAKRILARFGSNCTDRGAALLRKVATPGQWQVLMPQLASPMKGVVTNMLRFYLLNPFKEPIPDGFKIEDILKWIAPLYPKSDAEALFQRIDSPKTKAILTLDIAQAIVLDLERFLTKSFGNVPNPFAFRLDRDPKLLEENVKGQVRDTRSGIISKACIAAGLEDLLYNPPYFRMESCPKGDRLQKLLLKAMDGDMDTVLNSWSWNYDLRRNHAWATILYVLYCVNEHNLRLIGKIKSYKEILMILRQKTYVDHNSAWKQQNRDVQLARIEGFHKRESLLAWVLQLWQEIHSLPSPIVPDFRKSAAGWMTPEKESLFDSLFDSRTGKLLEGKLRRVPDTEVLGPMHHILKEFVRHLGLQVHHNPLSHLVKIRVNGPLRMEGTWLQITARAFDRWSSTDWLVELGGEFFDRLRLKETSHPVGHATETQPTIEERQVDPDGTVGDFNWLMTGKLVGRPWTVRRGVSQEGDLPEPHKI